MREQLLFEYAVIRIVPRVEREEFINTGVILFCKKAGYLGVRYQIDKSKLICLSPEVDVDCLHDSLKALETISLGDVAGGPIARLDTPSRFRWLTATRSTILQTSKVHPGLCDDPAATLEALFQKLVL
jgi:hypothetical protein